MTSDGCMRVQAEELVGWLDRQVVLQISHLTLLILL